MAGCSSGSIFDLLNPSRSTTTYVSRCPALATYSAEQQRQAAAELRAMSPGAVVPSMIDDYAVLRSRCRALSGN